MFRKTKQIFYLLNQLADNIDDLMEKYNRLSGRYGNTRYDVKMLQGGEVVDLKNMLSLKYRLDEVEKNNENNRQNLNLLLGYLKLYLDLEKGEKVIKKLK